MPTHQNEPGRAIMPVIAGVFFLLIFVSPRAADGQAREASLEELTRASSDVVLGAVAAKQSYWEEGGKRIFTEVRLRVSDRLKGAAAEETVVVVPGGQVGNVLYEVSDMPVFVEGEEVLVFLWRDPQGRHLVTGAAQGKLRVVGDERGGRMLEPGAGRLLRAGEAGAAPTGAEAAALDGRRIPLDDFVRAVRGVERE